MNTLHHLVRDLRGAARTLVRSAGFSAAVVAILALGIGANTTVFSVVHTVLLQPLPYPQADRIVRVHISTQLGPASLVSIPQFQIWREYTQAFEDLAACEVGGPGTLSEPSGAQRPVKTVQVTPEYFSVLGARTTRGRLLTTDDQSRTAVLSERLARSLAYPLWISLENVVYQVVGVLSSEFRAIPEADVWLPLQVSPGSVDHTNRLQVIGRLKTGVTLPMAQRQLWFAAGAFHRKYPSLLDDRDTFTATPLRDVLIGDVRPALFVLTGAVAFLLLIVCANAAFLLFARGTRRIGEIATRLALGASRSRIVMQLMSESTLLAIAGGAAGVALGHLGIRAVFKEYPGSLPLVASSGPVMNADVLWFALAVTLLVAVLFGIAPAWKAAGVNLSSCFKDDASHLSAGLRRSRTRSALVIAEVAAAVILLAGAGLLISRFASMQNADRGFESRYVLTVELPATGPKYERAADVDQMLGLAMRRIEAVSGVASAAATSSLPLQPALLSFPFVILGREQRTMYHGLAQWRSVSPKYFEVFRSSLTAGRAFDETEATPVAIINRMMARRFFQGSDPLGQRIAVGQGDQPRVIVGVVEDIRDLGLDRSVESTIYIPVAQVGDALNAKLNRSRPLSLAVRTNINPVTLRGEIQHALFTATGILPGRVRLMDEIVAESTARVRFSMVLITTFAAIALALALSGIYALMSYSVEERTREFGIRIAIGASPEALQKLVLMDSVRLALCGLAIGVTGSLALSRYLVSLIHGVRSFDPGVMAVVSALLVMTALLAACVPARRALRADPVASIRRSA